MSESLSNLGTPKVDATEQNNVAGQMTPVLSFSPIDGIEMEVQNRVDGKEGVPIYFVPKDSNGDFLPKDTEVAIRWDAPHLSQPEIVSYTLSNIRQYQTLSLSQQQNEDYRDRTRVELQGSSLVVEDNEEMEIAVNSSEVIDWANSELYVDQNAVSTRSGE